MGSFLEKQKQSMTEKNFEKLVTLLINTADHVLYRKRIDKYMEGAVSEVREDMELFKDGSAGVIVGRIRVSGPTVAELTVPELLKHMGKDGTFPLTVMDALCKKWEERDLLVLKTTLLSMKDRIKVGEHKPTDNTSNKNEVDAFPMMPPPEDRDKMPYDWTAFGFLPKSEERMKQWIDECTADLPSKKLANENALMFNGWGNVVGRIIPVTNEEGSEDLVQ